MNQVSVPSESATQPVRYVLLHGRYFVHQEIFDCVRLQVGDPYWRLDPHRRYRARGVCGEPFWALLSATERKVAGSCFAQLVKHKKLPLVKVSKAGCYPNQYELVEIT